MDFIIVFGIGAILVATGIITPKPKDDEVVEAEVVKTEEVVTPPPEIKSEPEPTPAPAPEPTPTPAPAPEPEPAKEPETNEEINQELAQEQEAKPEEPELETIEEDNELAEEGTGWLNVVIYILGAIAVIAAGVYFFMRREPDAKTAADIGRQESSQQPEPEPAPAPEPEPEQQVQEEVQTETSEEQPQSDNNDQSSNNDDENNNR